MEHRREAAATDAQKRVPVEDRQHAREHHHPEELPDDYAEWLDGWMFSDPEEQQEDEL